MPVAWPLFFVAAENDGDPPVIFWEMALRLVFALICGGLVGWNRERSGRAAGMRTHMMVSLGAAAFAIISIQLLESIEGNFDINRTVAAIIGGVGFLGAGAIIQAGGRIRGLTTAAGLWVMAGVGAAMGFGQYQLGIVVTLLAYLTLAFARIFEGPAAGDRDHRENAQQLPANADHDDERADNTHPPG